MKHCETIRTVRYIGELCHRNYATETRAKIPQLFIGHTFRHEFLPDIQPIHFFSSCLWIQPWGYNKSGTSINSLKLLQDSTAWPTQLVDLDTFGRDFFEKVSPYYYCTTNMLLSLVTFTSLIAARQFTRKTIPGHVRHDFCREAL